MANQEGQPERLTLVEVARSVAAAFFGVQKDKHRTRDFAHGRPYQFVIVGLVGVVLFVLAVVGVVALVLRLVAP
jgi:hypothetical protein